MYYVEYKNMMDKDAQFQAWLGLDVLVIYLHESKGLLRLFEINRFNQKSIYIHKFSCS